MSRRKQGYVEALSAPIELAALEKRKDMFEALASNASLHQACRWFA
jgi:hypothetical protein